MAAAPGVRRSELGDALRACRSAFIGVGLMSCMINLLYLTGSIFMLEVYDRVLPSRSIPTLVGLVVLAGGLYIAQPFRPGDAFQVNLAEPARYVTLRVYDMGGHLVRVLDERYGGDFVSIAWDGLNGDGEKAKKGPLVAVALVERSDGAKDTLRGIFLFEP